MLEYIERNVYLPKLEKVTFKSEVTIFNTLYFNSPNLKEYVLVDNSNFKSIDKVIYTADKQTLYAYPGGLEAKEFIIPDFVRNVNHNAFAFTNNLEKIIINSNMVLTESTFAYCTSVKTVVINFKTNVLSKGCFAFCTNLTSIKIHENAAITMLDSHCFHGCISLQRLDFKNELEIVEESCFQDCQSLVEVNLSQLYSIPKSCFKGNLQSQLNLHMGTNLRIINEEAFMDTKITEFICPENLIIIEAYAFSNCTELINFKLNENIQRLEGYSFYNVGIRELYIPDSIEYINSTSFCNSTHIEFKFSEGGHPIYYVENDCFMNKTGGLMFVLWKKGSVFEIPQNVKIISNEAIKSSNF